MDKEQEVIDKIVIYRDKINDITNRIELMEDIIDKTIEHNIGAKLRIQMNSFPIDEDPNRYIKKESKLYGEDEEENRKPGEAPKDIAIRGMFFGTSANNYLPFKKPETTNNFMAIQPIDIKLDESEVLLMVGAILNLTRNRKTILQKEYRKLAKQLNL